ncbi:MAG: hypothetical protein PUD80_04390 [Firmicutes bacterium]|nr:hypothetical protein [Bacillota bacterium]
MKIRRYYVAFTVIVVCVCIALLWGCGRKEAPVTIDYGKSELYSQADMDAAIALIEAEYTSGSELHAIRYAGDDHCTPENLQWMNDLAQGQELDVTFTQCIMFECDFHSPKRSQDAGSLNPDEEYRDWQWWLARADGGEWYILTGGYG